MKSHKIEKHTPKSSKVTLYYCEICAIEFDKVENLKTHRTEEQCSNIYHCEICDLNFDEVENLKTHKKSHCSEIRFLAIFYLEQFGISHFAFIIDLAIIIKIRLTILNYFQLFLVDLAGVLD